MRKYVIGVVVGALFSSMAVALAGNLIPPGGPAEASGQMYTLKQIYDRLDSGAAATKMDTFTEPGSGPGSTMHTLDEIMAQAPALDNTNGAAAADVLTSQTFWGLTAGQWATQTGTMPNNGTGSTIVPTTTNQSVASGYWSSANTVRGDSDLVAGNIKCGVTIFGVKGECECVAKTGQTTSYGTGDDGEYQKGCLPSEAPSSGSSFGGYNRTSFVGSCLGFTDNGDGTVTDNLTGLMWAENANLDGTKVFTDALTYCNDLSLGGYDDWRLPNINELRSLFDPGLSDKPYLPDGHPFTGVQSGAYWSSTTLAYSTDNAWDVYLYFGSVRTSGKTYSFYVWPVRGGQ